LQWKKACASPSAKAAVPLAPAWSPRFSSKAARFLVLLIKIRCERSCSQLALSRKYHAKPKNPHPFKGF
jgi:hypothetical protein